MSELLTRSETARHVDAILTALDWPRDSFFVGGSGGLALRGIRQIGSDLDLGVPTRVWHALLSSGEWSVYTPNPTDSWRRCDPPYLFRRVLGTEVNVFYAWRRRGAEETPYNDFNRVFRDGIQWVDGWPCLRLSILLSQKADAVGHPEVRPKDVADIALIADYMRPGEAA